MDGDKQRSTTPALLDYAGAQAYLGGISRSTLKTLIGSGQLRGVVSIGRRRLLSIHALDAFIAARTLSSPADAA